MTKSSEPPGKDAPEAPSVEQYIVKDPERFALNLARALEAAGKAAAAWAAPRERGEVRDSVAEPVADMVKTFSKLSEYWLSDPTRALEAQTRLFSSYMDVWANTIRRAGASPDLPGGPASDAASDRHGCPAQARTGGAIAAGPGRC